MLHGECRQTKIEQEAMMPTLNVPASSETVVPSTATATATPAAPPLAADDAVGCNPPLVTPGADTEAPHDGDHNQGGARPAGLEYQRELGTEQDA
jgi:hypothetical protein